MPRASNATALAKSKLVPPNDFAHTKFPALSNLETNTSELLAKLLRLNVPAPGSKSAVPENCPVV